MFRRVRQVAAPGAKSVVSDCILLLNVKLTSGEDAALQILAAQKRKERHYFADF